MPHTYHCHIMSQIILYLDLVEFGCTKYYSVLNKVLQKNLPLILLSTLQAIWLINESSLHFGFYLLHKTLYIILHTNIV